VSRAPSTRLTTMTTKAKSKKAKTLTVADVRREIERRLNHSQLSEPAYVAEHLYYGAAHHRSVANECKELLMWIDAQVIGVDGDE